MPTSAPLNVKECSPVKRSEPTPEELIRVLINQVTAAECYGSPAQQEGNGPCSEEIIIEFNLDGMRYLLVRLPKVDRPRIQLSPREQEIVRMVAQGHPNKVIADVLSISAWTVCTHLRRIFAKLGVGSRAAMVARMLEPSGVREETALRLPTYAAAPSLRRPQPSPPPIPGGRPLIKGPNR
jgi:DNA-binding CsgD family transcriptional regulator